MDQAIIEERHNKSLWLTIATPNNTIGLSLISALERSLKADDRDPEAEAIILRGSGTRLFSPGLDLGEVAGYDRPRMAEFMKRFEGLCLQLYQHPKPTIAILNGHALAGGAILASCCDFRLARREVRVGLTEMNLDLALPFGSQRIIEQIVGYRRLREIVFYGRSYPAEKARELGWIDQIVDDRLEEDLRKLLKRLRRQSPTAFRDAKSHLKCAVAAEISACRGEALKIFLDAWFSEPAQRRIHKLKARI